MNLIFAKNLRMTTPATPIGPERFFYFAAGGFGRRREPSFNRIRNHVVFAIYAMWRRLCQTAKSLVRRSRRYVDR